MARPHSSVASGFTLIELMITVAIVAILASVAVPAYTSYLRRGQLPEATSFLSDYRVKMEQYYQDNRNYGTGNCATGAVTPSWATFTPGAKYFTFTCRLDWPNPGDYTITAAGNSGLTTGYTYTIDDTTSNFQHTTYYKGAAVAGKNCWLIKGDEC